MLVDVGRFKELIRKATLNYLLDSVQLNVTEEGWIETSMIGSDKSVITILKVKNDIFTGTKEEFSLNFTNPNTEVKPFLDLIDDEEVEFKLKKNEFVLNDQYTLCLDDPSVISTFNGKSIEDNVEFFTKLFFCEDFTQSFSKIKKIGSRFGKVYFIVEKEKLYIETSDRLSKYSNKLRFLLAENIKHDDIVLCIDYTNMVKLMSVIDDSFTIQLTYFEDQEMGGLYCENTDKSEKYFVSSMQDE